MNPGFSKNEVHIWFLRSKETDRIDPHFMNFLSADERKRAQRYHFERDRVQFILRHVLLCQLLAGFLNEHPRRLAFSYTKEGKPFLDNPRSANGLYFNMSYTDHLIMFGFCRGSEIGVDVEHVHAFSEIKSIVDTHFTKEEAIIFNTLSMAQQIDYFFNCWTTKEAVVKATGQGLQIPLNQVNTGPLPADPADDSYDVWVESGAIRLNAKNMGVKPAYAASVALFCPFDKRQLFIREGLWSDVIATSNW